MILCVVCKIIPSWADQSEGYFIAQCAYVCSHCLDGMEDMYIIYRSIARKNKSMQIIKEASRKRNERVQLRKKLLFLQKLMQHPKSDLNIVHVLGPMV